MPTSVRSCAATRLISRSLNRHETIFWRGSYLMMIFPNMESTDNFPWDNDLTSTFTPGHYYCSQSWINSQLSNNDDFQGTQFLLIGRQYVSFVPFNETERILIVPC